MSNLRLVRSVSSHRNYLLTNLSNGGQTLVGMPNGGGALDVCRLYGGVDYDTCMGEAFFVLGNDQHTCTPLTQEEADQWCIDNTTDVD